MKDYDRGWNDAIRAASRFASAFSAREYSVHPDIRHKDMNETAQVATHSTAQQISLGIQTLMKNPPKFKRAKVFRSA
jgi:hypothetical protein